MSNCQNAKLSNCFSLSLKFEFPEQQIGGFRLPNRTFNGLFGLIANQVVDLHFNN